MNALRLKSRLAACTRMTATSIALTAALAVSPAMASTFRLQSTTVILDERDGRSSFSVTNTGNEPILLLTKVEDLVDEKFAGNILITPAVTRIDPGQSQIVNFSLKKGVSSDRERMLKASFEGVTQKAESGMKMPLRQQIGFIVQPKSVPVVPKPWEDLRITQQGQQIELSNTGKHVVRLGPALTLQPSGKVVPLPAAYIMPGESVTTAAEDLPAVNEVKITPLSRFGFVQNEAVLKIAR
jgi:fimbrial chaperone protein